MNKKLLNAVKNGYKETVSILLENGAHVNAKDIYYGITALMEASEYGHTQTVALLLEKRAHVNVKDNHGKTALIKASEYGHTQTVALLLEKGANVNAKWLYGGTALTEASKKRHKDIVTLIKNHITRMVCLVIKKGRTKSQNPIPLVRHSHKDIAYCIALYVTE